MDALRKGFIPVNLDRYSESSHLLILGSTADAVEGVCRRLVKKIQI